MSILITCRAFFRSEICILCLKVKRLHCLEPWTIRTAPLIGTFSFVQVCLKKEYKHGYKRGHPCALSLRSEVQKQLRKYLQDGDLQRVSMSEIQKFHQICILPHLLNQTATHITSGLGMQLLFNKLSSLWPGIDDQGDLKVPQTVLGGMSDVLTVLWPPSLQVHHTTCLTCLLFKHLEN